MIDTKKPLEEKTFIAFFPVGFSPNEKLPYPVAWRLELFTSQEMGKDNPARMYADAIQAGESIDVVITRVMTEVFHVSKWEVLSIGYGPAAPDRHGTMIPRLHVELAVSPEETSRGKINGMYPVWNKSSRAITPSEWEMLSKWYSTFLSSSRDAFGVEFDGSVDTLKTMDRIITEAWETEPPQNIPMVAATFGTYVGEVLVQHSGGKWVMYEGMLMVEIPGKAGEIIHCSPLLKTWKRIIYGEGDSLWYYVTSSLRISKGSIV